MCANPGSPRYLDYVLSTVGEAFGGLAEKEFEELASEIRHSRRTTFYWLKSLERQGFLAGSYVYHGKGRPRLAYRMTEKFQTFLDIHKKGLGITPAPLSDVEPRRHLSSPLAESGGDMKYDEGDQYGTDFVVVSFESLRLICPFRVGEICRALSDRRQAQECHQNLCRVVLQRQP